MKIKALILTVFALAFGVVFAGAFDVKNKEDKSGTFDFSKPGPLTVTAEKMLGSRNDESFSASGKVVAVSKPFTLLSELVVKEKDTYYFAPDTSPTSCSNDFDHLHWDISGEVTCKTSRYLLIKNAVLRLWDMPVMWMPYWYYPLETDYGLRVMPGYTGRWGTFLLTKYVYPIAGSFDDGAYGLSGSSRLDFRKKNGLAVGQSLKWQLGEFGRGKFKVYYADDNDYDYYVRRQNRHHRKSYDYYNWESEVERNRYALSLEHFWDPTERDIVRINAGYYSDSRMSSDFLRERFVGTGNRIVSSQQNELAWEHLESTVAFGTSVSGSLNDFYHSVARLPEVYFDIAPQPFFSTPLNYESVNRLGYLNRDYAKHGNSKTTAAAMRYKPGRWANYNAARLDTYHRFTAPFKVHDVVSVVPRVGLRGTYWSDAGLEVTNPLSKAGSIGDDVFRGIVEGGITFAARGQADLGDSFHHVVEPYLDMLVQASQINGLDKGQRPYIFDSLDSSSDFLDQFAGRSRNLPYSYHGITPGVRNVFKTTEEDGTKREYLDLDIYMALQFNDTEWTRASKFNRLVSNVEDPLYGRDGEILCVPGMRVSWAPTEDAMLFSRLEWDGQNDTLAYADISWRHQLSEDFNYTIGYQLRDQRRWDYGYSPKYNDFNWTDFKYFTFEAEWDISDMFATGPYIVWDYRKCELDEVGMWFDYRTDCLGFRFMVGYENDYTNITGYEYDSDVSIGFYIYLRAFGPASGMAIAE